MTLNRLRAWWPLIGVLAMLALGWSVGQAPTALDRWFLHTCHRLFGLYPSWLLVFTDWGLLGPILATCVGVALFRRQWRLAAVAAATPFLSLWFTEAVKHLIGREKDGYLAYPSGHSTMVISIMGMFVLVLGVRLWTMTVAIIMSLLGMLGQVACYYHWLTDVIGAALSTTAIVCAAAVVVSARGRKPAPVG